MGLTRIKMRAPGLMGEELTGKKENVAEAARSIRRFSSRNGPYRRELGAAKSMGPRANHAFMRPFRRRGPLSSGPQISGRSEDPRVAERSPMGM